MTTYDIEVFPNYFLACFKNLKTGKKTSFEISEWLNQRSELIKFITTDQLVGYNSSDYDDTVLNFIASEPRTNAEIYKLSQSIIDDRKYIYRPYKYCKGRKPSIDLLKLCFPFSKRISLKVFQVLINWPKVQDLPKPFDEPVKFEERDLIEQYCWNDVDSTEAILRLSKKKLLIRMALKKRFGVDCFSMDDVNSGVKILEVQYAKKTGSKEFLEMRTPRASINLGECILPNIKFKSKEFNDLLNKMKNKTITSTKGALKYKVLYGGVCYVFGTGGIHSVDRPGIVKPSENELFIDCDVSSQYPSQWINNKWCPAHLQADMFVPIYQANRDERVNYWKPRFEIDPTAKNWSNMLKLAINGP